MENWWRYGWMKFVTDTLHIPELRSNLISVSKLAAKGVKVEFDQHKAQVRSVSGTIIMMAKRCGCLYTIETTSRTPTALVSQTKWWPATFDTWHWRFGHAAPETIHEMAVKMLVDGLNITEELTIGGRCEDCIFGKHSTHPFNDNGYQETEILERIHINIWGLSPIQSAGGASYFMLLMDGHLSYHTVAFLKTKSADIILNIFETYHNEAE